MSSPLFINGVQYQADLAMARVSHNGMARLTLNGATLPFGTKLYYREEPSLAQLTHLVKALIAKGAEPEFLKSLVAFAVNPAILNTESIVLPTPDKE